MSMAMVTWVDGVGAVSREGEQQESGSHQGPSPPASPHPFG